VYRVGLLNKGSPVTDASPFGAALISGLEKHGYTLGRNLALERRGAEGHVERLPRLLDELVASNVDVILAISYPAALAAKRGTNVPVVVFSSGDPVATGLIDSLARPGGHLTGISDMTAELSPKRLQLLKEIVPGIKRVAMIWNADDLGMTLRYQESEAVARQLGITVEPLGVRAPKDFEPAFALMASSKPDAIFIVSDGLTVGHRRQVFDFASLYRTPALYEDSESVVRDGGLMFYGPDLNESFDRVSALIDRILKGAQPKDLPFEQPTRFRFVVNLKTAKALGLAIPAALIAQADEVIE
jgi:putative ABC transport system substrate-binding protein